MLSDLLNSLKFFLGVGHFYAPITQCIACDSKDYVLIAKYTYRCNACGHEGGDGYPEFKAKQRKDQFLTLSSEDQDAQIKQLLKEAKSEFNDCLACMKTPDAISEGIPLFYDYECGFDGESGNGLEQDEIHLITGSNKIDEIINFRPNFFPAKTVRKLTRAMKYRSPIIGSIDIKQVKKVVKILEHY